MVRHTLTILQQMLEDFKSVSDHFGTLSIKELSFVNFRFPQGSNVIPPYSINGWNQIDSFCYFSHNFITIPPPCWTNLGHRHGVKVLGTFITEWDDGALICKQIFEDITQVTIIVEKLVEITCYYQFDGWLINIENKIMVCL